MVVGLIGSDYEDDLKAAFENVMQQIDDYQHNGSGWVLDQFVELDVSIVMYAPFMGKDIDDDDDDYDEENKESVSCNEFKRHVNFMLQEITLSNLLEIYKI